MCQKKRRMEKKAILTDLENRTAEVIKHTGFLLEQEEGLLNKKKDETAWSALECVEHLNRYGDFYLPELKRCIDKAKKGNFERFKSGWLGNYFAEMMLPKPNFKKMKTFKVMNPTGSRLNKKQTLEKFMGQQDEMLRLLQVAATVDLTRNKTAVSISKLIKLRLGDTFRVVIYHNQRHMEQALRAING